MKWLIGSLVALVMVSSALAGEDPYVAVVGNDISAKTFYLSPKYTQFLYDQLSFFVPTTQEGFTARNPIMQPEICDTQGLGSGPLKNQAPFTTRGNVNSRVTAGNSGWYQWKVALPKKPVGEINLVLQCGVLKPNTFADLGFAAVQYCAAETGERIGEGFCAHEFSWPGENTVEVLALPKITALAFPGPYSDFTPFYLTAYKNPGKYEINFNKDVPTEPPGSILNDASTQLLDGRSDGTRILLKTCMDKTILVKIPVTGQINAGNPVFAPLPTQRITREETDLVEGDVILVRMEVPRYGTTDIYCHSESLKVMGIGESVW